VGVELQGLRLRHQLAGPREEERAGRRRPDRSRRAVKEPDSDAALERLHAA
jgi:hypothetical protein